MRGDADPVRDPRRCLVPRPVSLRPLTGTLTLTARTRVVVDVDDPAVDDVARHLVADLHAATGLVLAIGGAPGDAGDLVLSLDPGSEPEAYTLHIDDHGARLAAATAAGLWNASRTLLQLVPQRPSPAVLPALEIADRPRFAWRGAMLDVARHFFGVDQVKRFIELIARYKLNRLHLHLTDDQGWRIEVPDHPPLAHVGGATCVGGGAGGWYTLEDWAEIVAHAQRHHVVVVPEVDMPGHTNAALTALPELNLDGMPPPAYTGTEVGFSTMRLDLPATRGVVADIIRTVAMATPGGYVHIGGDEAHATDASDYLEFVELLQSLVAEHGVTMVGWEEIAQAPLRAGTIVQHWLRPEVALAAPEGCRFVMSPAGHTYLDMRHDEHDPLGRRWAGDIDVDRAYLWDPAGLVPGVDDSRIAGVEAPLWTEKVATFAEVEHLCFPRLLCLAEVGWTPQADRQWDDFAVRLAAQCRDLAPEVNLHHSALLPPPA